jgi:ParE toxin of type II toxin-antitoxin system, parDE
MADQDGMRAIGTAVFALADDPNPCHAFIRGDYRRLKVGPYRVMYVLEDDLITIERVDLALTLPSDRGLGRVDGGVRGGVDGGFHGRVAGHQEPDKSGQRHDPHDREHRAQSDHFPQQPGDGGA